MNISKEIKRQWKRACWRERVGCRTTEIGKKADGSPLTRTTYYKRYQRLGATVPLRRWAQSEARGGNTVAASWCRHKGIQCGR